VVGHLDAQGFLNGKWLAVLVSDFFDGHFRDGCCGEILNSIWILASVIFKSLKTPILGGNEMIQLDDHIFPMG